MGHIPFRECVPIPFLFLVWGEIEGYIPPSSLSPLWEMVGVILRMMQPMWGSSLICYPQGGIQGDSGWSFSGMVGENLLIP